MSIIRDTLLFALAFLAAVSCGRGEGMKTGPAQDRVADAEARIGKSLRAALRQSGFDPARGVVLAGFKEEKLLEVWCRRADESWGLWKTLPICAASGGPGPKEREGDGQVPEGRYAIRPGALNPRSRFHLSMDIGYPNREDRALGRTGSFIMIHGGCASIGCLAIGDEAIEELFLLVSDAFTGGLDAVPVYLYPFRMTPKNRAAHPNGHPTWDGLQGVHDAMNKMLGR